MFARFVLAVVVALASHGYAADSPAVAIEIKDLTPKFLAFYEAAEKENAAPDRRWELWQEMYDFAAVPPTPEGKKIARELLEKAWPRYGSALEAIRGGAATLTPDPAEAARKVSELLQPEKPINVTVLVYVGAFDDNAFTAAGKKSVTVALPIEMEREPRARVMVHELTHAVHIGVGSFSGGWIRSIGATVVSEGLAMRVTQRLFPGDSEAQIAEHTPGWLVAANAKREEILRGILPVLGSDKNEDVMRFTMGTGPAGLEREAYYTGWLVVEEWLRSGMSFAEIARIPEKEMPARVAETVERLLAESAPAT